ncbi:hypothetical protein MLD38_038169 [Melastoma candidum]|uniref:Uncharacterized protein n=1 Tax=Melastoma candidum TaxID=119954 RepID=A0ACB9KZ86_9MYRT|nr:hypothetical protein MLD38_038169 [Melastoma candidum]
MNRSFRVNHDQRQMVKDREDDLALFLEMRIREKERSDPLLGTTEEFDTPLGSKPGTSPIFNITSAAPPRKTAADDFLNSDGDKNDYDWLLTPPGTPLFPSLEMEPQKTLMSQLGTPKANPTVLKSRLANSLVEPAPVRTSVATRQPVSSPGLSTSGGGVSRRPSSSGGPGSRPGTPTGRSTLTSSKPSRSSTPTSRPTLSSSRPTATSSKPSPIVAKPTLSSSKPVTSVTKPSPTSRSTTPSRSIPRSSTPTSRPTVPPPKPISRSATPTRRPSTPTSAPGISAPQTRVSSVTKPTTTTSKSSVPSRGPSPTVKSRPWKPSEMPGYSLDTPPNLRTTLPGRPLSATRGRPGAPSARSSSVEPSPAGRPRRQSCSPSRGRLMNGGLHASGSSVPAASRSHHKVNDNVSPVVLGTKMVERVINMRKLAPPKQDEKHSPRSNISGKSATSPDGSGFGRTLSKKSLDMAIRHMDIRRTIPGNLRPLMTNIPASSMYSVRTGAGPTRGRTVSVSDSPLATSSNASSEVSVNNNGIYVDVNGLLSEDGVSERDNLSPGILRGRR